MTRRNDQTDLGARESFEEPFLEEEGSSEELEEDATALLLLPVAGSVATPSCRDRIVPLLQVLCDTVNAAASFLVAENEVLASYCQNRLPDRSSQSALFKSLLARVLRHHEAWQEGIDLLAAGVRGRGDWRGVPPIVEHPVASRESRISDSPSEEEPTQELSQRLKEAGYTRLYASPLRAQAKGCGPKRVTLVLLDPGSELNEQEGLVAMESVKRLCLHELSELGGAEQWESVLAAAAARHVAAARAEHEGAFMLVDTTTEYWTVVWIDEDALSDCGLWDYCTVGSPVWNVFAVPESAEEAASADKTAQTWAACSEAVRSGSLFSLLGLKVMGKPATKTYTLHFRPSTIGEELLVPGEERMGGVDSGNHPYYIVQVVPVPRASLAVQHYELIKPWESSLCSWLSLPPVPGLPVVKEEGGGAGEGEREAAVESAAAAAPGPGPELVAGQVLGRGVSGAVWSGKLDGQDVAIKVVQDLPAYGQPHPTGPPEEVRIMELLGPHPNLVRKLSHDRRPSRRPALWDSANCYFQAKLKGTEEEAPVDPGETWLVMELCSKGTLQDALARNWFREGHNSRGKLRLDLVLDIAIGIARGLVHMHAKSVVHLDLTSRNVLLADSQGGGESFIPKVADFGLSRELRPALKPAGEPQRFSSPTRVPPERYTSTPASMAADVYSFGVLLWELAAGEAAWGARIHTQVVGSVAVLREPLPWGKEVPADYVKLAKECLAWHAALRPGMPHALACLRKLREEETGQLKPSAA